MVPVRAAPRGAAVSRGIADDALATPRAQRFALRPW
jgi:hypothetical protein